MAREWPRQCTAARCRRPGLDWASPRVALGRRRGGWRGRGRVPETPRSAPPAGARAAHRSAARGAGSATVTRPPRAAPGTARRSARSQRTLESCWPARSRRSRWATRWLGWRAGCRKRGRPGSCGSSRSRRVRTESCWTERGFAAIRTEKGQHHQPVCTPPPAPTPLPPVGSAPRCRAHLGLPVTPTGLLPGWAQA